MDWLKNHWPRRARYRPLADADDNDTPVSDAEVCFSRAEYYVFLLLGLATLWPFNMFLNAGPYFQQRLLTSDDDSWARDNFQAAEASASTVVNLIVLVAFTFRQVGANYPSRILKALLIQAITFVLLAVSTRVFLHVGPATYLGFLIVAVSVTSFGTGLLQNACFAYVNGFQQPSYTQAMMVGQAVAGVMPCLVQILLALLVDPDPTTTDARPPQNPSNAVLGYFLTATLVAIITIVASLRLFARRSRATPTDPRDGQDSPRADPLYKHVPLTILANKLRWIASSVIINFAITLAIFPVMTQEITSLAPSLSESRSRLTQPAVFIPLAFFVWSLGDLLGRVPTAWPAFRIGKRPRLVMVMASSRALLLPVYFLCNVRGRGAVVPSDAFYMAFQLVFGFTNGYIGSLCMMSAAEYVDVEEAKAAGSFMAVCLTLGLAVGSLLSFAFTT